MDRAELPAIVVNSGNMVLRSLPGGIETVLKP